MKTPYKLLALDMDGTLLDPLDMVTAATAAAIDEARAAGVQVVLASGRAPRQMVAIHHQLGLDTPIVAHHGAIVLNPAPHCTLHHAPVDVAAARHLMRIVHEHDSEGNVHLELQCGPHDRWAVERWDARLQRSIERWHLEPPDTVGEDFTPLDDPTTAISKLWFHTSKAAMVVIRQRMDSELAQHLGALAFDRTSLTVLAAGVSKASALRWLAAERGIAPAQVMAIGDDLNDVEMLQWAGLGVAMGNAIEEARAAADVHTVSNAEDGVALAIRRWLLQEP